MFEFKDLFDLIARAAPWIAIVVIYFRMEDVIKSLVDRVTKLKGGAQGVELETQPQIDHLVNRVEVIKEDSPNKKSANDRALPISSDENPRNIIRVRWDDVVSLIELYSHLLFPERYEFADGPVCAIGRLRNFFKITEDEFRALIEMRNYRFEAQYSDNDEFSSAEAAQKFSDSATTLIESLKTKIEQFRKFSTENEQKYHAIIAKLRATKKTD